LEEQRALENLVVLMSEFWKDRRVFVTGATGFVGANLTKALVEREARVICLQRDDNQPNSLDVLNLRSRVTVVHGELQDLALQKRILNEYEIDAVFHLAAQAIVGAANRSPVSTFESNIRGTYMLLEACRESRTVSRIVVASSDKAYGTSHTLPYREDYSLEGVFPYDVSKACTDLISRSFAATYELPAVVTRSANIYGPADLNLSRIIPGTIVSVLKSESPIIRSDGTPLREFVHTDDVVSAYLKLAENIDKTRGEAFNIGSNVPVQILELTNKIIELSGKNGRLHPTILLDRKIEHEIDAQYLSAEKIEERIGWTASVGLDEGLRQTIEWYNQNLGRLT
jgi:CDP-glucose 4,6-dehydratase